MSLCLSFFFTWDLCYSYPSFRTSLIHMHIQCAVDNQVLSRHRARVHGEVLPASSVPFVDSSLMKMGIVLNYITEHKAVLQMKTFCAWINDDVFLFFFSRKHNIASVSMVRNIVEIMDPLMQAGHIALCIQSL